MATDTEWQEAYDYLLGRLRELGADDLIAEMTDAAAMPVRRSPTTREEVLLSKMPKRELGRTALEAPTTRAAFHAALLVLESRPIHLPAILDALQQRFENHLPRFISEYGADAAIEGRENSLLREAAGYTGAHEEFRATVETLRRLHAEDR